MPLLSVIVLTKNEEVHLPRLIASLEGLDYELFVVDSGSTDRTVEIAEAAGAHVVFHPFETQAKSLNWALENLPLRAPWTMRLDADERLTPELARELSHKLPNAPSNISSFQMRRRVHFWRRWIRYGDMYPWWLVRVWRTGLGRCEERNMDEHFITRHGCLASLASCIIDENLKGFGYWVEKHNAYADREVRDLLALRNAQMTYKHLAPGKARRVRWAKESIYARMPLFVRPALYFFYRYVLRLGFLDGLAGLVFHFNQGFWYRLLVDIKIYESERFRDAGEA